MWDDMVLPVFVCCLCVVCLFLCVVCVLFVCCSCLWPFLDVLGSLCALFVLLLVVFAVFLKVVFWFVVFFCARVSGEGESYKWVQQEEQRRLLFCRMHTIFVLVASLDVFDILKINMLFILHK